MLVRVASTDGGAAIERISPVLNVVAVKNEKVPVALAVNVIVPILTPFFAIVKTAVPVLAAPAFAYEPVKLTGKIYVCAAIVCHKIADAGGCPNV